MAMAAERDFIVVEDDFESEAGDLETTPPALRAGAAGQRVAYVATLLQSLSPALRLGVLVASPSLIRTARALRQDIGSLADETGALEKDLIRSMGQNPVPRAHVDSLLEQIATNRLEINRKATDRMIAMGDSLTAEERGHMVDALLRFRNLGRADHWKE